MMTYGVLEVYLSNSAYYDDTRGLSFSGVLLGNSDYDDIRSLSFSCVLLEFAVVYREERAVICAVSQRPYHSTTARKNNVTTKLKPTATTRGEAANALVV